MTDPATIADESKYTYDVKSHRFRAPNGRYVSASEVTGIRDLIIAKKVERTAELVNALYDGVIGPNAFVTAMRLEIKRTTMMQYMLGRGGANALTQSDYGRIGQLLKTQYQYLNNFTTQIMDGKVTRSRAIDRAGMYIDTTVGAHERAKGIAWDVDLPEYPPNHTRCLCEWTLENDGPNRILAYWKVHSGNPCEYCENNEAMYAPLIFERGKQDA
jgi:hypothetical protein